MCAVSYVSEYYTDPFKWVNRTNPIFEDLETLKLRKDVSQDVLDKLQEVIKRLDDIDKRLGDIECQDDKKDAFLNAIGLDLNNKS